jgi:antirestriction protein ArdC
VKEPNHLTGERKMKNEKIREITSKAIEQLIAALNEGRSETLTSYLTAMAKFHRYSLRNVMLIAMQKPTATHVAGFHTWHKLGRFVKKGEKGILIIAPVVRRKETTEAQESETAEDRSVVAFRGACVFDITQTDGQPLPEIASVQGDPSDNLARLKTLVAEQSIALEYSEDIAPARGTSAGGKITLLRGQAPAEEFATLVHELAHEMLHRDDRRNGTSKRVRETEAEAVSFVVCSAIGLETGTAAQDYIQLYEGDAKLLTESLDRIQQTANRILTAIAPEQPAPPA